MVGTFESHLKGQHSNLARCATQSYGVLLRRVDARSYAVLRRATLSYTELHEATKLKCYAVLRYASVYAMLCYAVPR